MKVSPCVKHEKEKDRTKYSMYNTSTHRECSALARRKQSKDLLLTYDKSVCTEYKARKDGVGEYVCTVHGTIIVTAVSEDELQIV